MDCVENRMILLVEGVDEGLYDLKDLIFCAEIFGQGTVFQCLHGVNRGSRVTLTVVLTEVGDMVRANQRVRRKHAKGALFVLQRGWGDN